MFAYPNQFCAFFKAKSGSFSQRLIQGIMQNIGRRFCIPSRTQTCDLTPSQTPSNKSFSLKGRVGRAAYYADCSVKRRRSKQREYLKRFRGKAFRP